MSQKKKKQAHQFSFLGLVAVFFREGNVRGHLSTAKVDSFLDHKIRFMSKTYKTHTRLLRNECKVRHEVTI